MKPFENKTVLVTGANNPHGIGAELARAFSDQGAKVAITYLAIPTSRAPTDAMGLEFYETQRAKSASEVVADIKKKGGVAIAKEIDLTTPEAAEILFAWAEACLGTVDILINNAAHNEASGDTLLEIDAFGIRRTFAVNVEAMVLLSQEFVKRRRAAGKENGRIVNISTDAAQLFAGQIIYGASKAAVEALTRSMAHEVAKFGITVNAVAPGPTQTGYISTDDEPEIVSRLVPLGRLGRPADTAATALFLASDEASWTTGQIIRTSGGHII